MLLAAFLRTEPQQGIIQGIWGAPTPWLPRQNGVEWKLLGGITVSFLP